jgi:peptidyl-prolyl cis-trans isomerase SurA
MTRTVSIWGLCLLGFAATQGQVASHAPTALHAAPAAEAAPALANADKPVARVNGSVLNAADLLREEYAIFPYARQHNGIPKDLAPQIRDGAMKMLIFEELSYQEALRRHMTIAPAKMQRAEADFRRQFGSPDAFSSFLRSDFHGSLPLLEQKIRRSLLIEAFLKDEVESKCTITPAMVRAYYEKNPARFQHPESWTFQTISILPPQNASADQLKEGRKRAEKAFEQAKQAKTAEQFGMLAEKLSDDDYRVVMGQHKPVPADQLPPGVIKSLRSLRVGQVSDLLQLDQAYTILRLGAHTPAGRTKFEDVRAQLAKELQQSRRNQLRAALDRSLRQKATIQEF